MVTRPARPSDLDAVREIYAHYVTHSTATFELTPPDHHDWTQRYRTTSEAGLPFLVAEIDGEIAGYAYCSPWKSRPAYRWTVEDSVYVAPWAARRGVGGALLDALLAECSRTGIRQVIAVVADTGDAASLELHRRREFVEAGRLTAVGFKHDRWLDTVMLQRSLP